LFIFIDECGDLGVKGSKYFIIGMLFYYGKDPCILNQVVNKHNKHLWSNGWPKDAEIKATNLYNYKEPKYQIDCSKLTLSPRAYLQNIYKDINSLDIKAAFIIHDPINQGRIMSNLHAEKKYNYLSKILYGKAINELESPLEIFVDQRNITLVKKQTHADLTIQRLNLDYRGYITNELSFQFAQFRKSPPEIDIFFEKSQNIKGLQIIDYLTWAIAKKYEGRNFWNNLTLDISKIEHKDNFK